MQLLPAIKLFASAARLGSVSAAARAAGVSIASASRQISALEKHLKVRLLNRGARTLTPTEAGDMLLQRVRPLIQEFEAALEAVDMLHAEPRGLLRVHVRSMTATQFLLPALPSFLDAHPQLGIEMVVSNQTHVDIIRDNIDVDLRYSQPDSLDLVAVKLGDHRMRPLMVASPDYLARRGTPATIGELVDHDVIAYNAGGQEPVWQYEDPAGRQQAIAIKPRLSTNDGATVRVAAISGLGISIVPHWGVEADLAEARLVSLFPDLTFFNRHTSESLFAVYQRSRYQTAKLRAFLRFCQATFGRA